MKRWPTKTLEEIADLFGGSTPSRDNPAFWNGDISWVTPTDLPMPDEGISTVGETKDCITQSGLDNSSATVVPIGTVLFSSRATIGKVAVADRPLTTNQGFANFVPRSEVSSRFLAYSLWHHREDIARLSGSTTFKEVSRGTLRKFQVPVPPLAEQERIVKLLDEADELRKLRAQAARRTATLIPALFHEMFGHSKYDPRNLGDLSETVMGQAPPGKECNTEGRGTPFVKAGEFGEKHPVIREWTTKPLRFAQSTDVLICVVGATCGKLNLGIDCAIGRSVAAIRPNLALVDQDFLYVCLQSWTLRLRTNSQGSAQGVITREMLARIPIPLPSLSLQKKFAQRVTEFREMEASQTASRERLEALFQSMLHRAFSGELTVGTEVVELQSSPEFIRAVLAAEIADRMHGHKPFGRVMLQKIIYLAEYHAQLAEIASEPRRFAAGPHDPDLIKQAESKMKAQEWYETVPRSGDSDGFEYHALSQAGGHRDNFEKLWPKKAAAIRKMIDAMKTWKTERCERFATVYAAWNDLLLWDAPATDDAILDQVLKHWHSDKLKISKSLWEETLAWMKREGYTPSGWGRPTAPKPQPELFAQE